MKSYPIVALLAASIITPTVQAEEQDKRLPVMVTAECDPDPVGQRLVYRAREEIRGSRRMREETEYLNSIVQVRFICLSPEQVDSGIVSKYSYVITALNTDGLYDYYITSVVGECGSSRVQSCAEGVVSKVDEALSALIATVKEGRLKYND